MSNRKFIKRNFSITKVNKFIKSGDVQYSVWEVLGPDNFSKDFVSQKEANDYVNNYIQSNYENLINKQIKQLWQKN